MPSELVNNYEAWLAKADEDEAATAAKRVKDFVLAQIKA